MSDEDEADYLDALRALAARILSYPPAQVAIVIREYFRRDVRAFKRIASPRQPGHSLKLLSKLVSLSDESSLQSFGVEQHGTCVGRNTPLSAETFDDRTLPS